MKFNFTSQICTTKEQSELLLALGLKKETADCHHWAYTQDSRRNSIPKRNQIWHTRIGTEESVQVCGLMTATFIPAWSLHRLIEIVPKLVKVPKPNYGWNGEDLMFHINDELHILYEDLCIGNEEYRLCSKYFYKSNLYDNFIDCIEWLIKEGYFNKEYLEELCNTF